MSLDIANKIQFLIFYRLGIMLAATSFCKMVCFEVENKPCGATTALVLTCVDEVSDFFGISSSHKDLNGKKNILEKKTFRNEKRVEKRFV